MQIKIITGKLYCKFRLKKLIKISKISYFVVLGDEFGEI